MFLLLKEKKKAKNKDNWNLWIWVFCPKMAVSWCISAFQQNLPRPLFLLCFLGARFLGQGVKKGNFGHPQKRKKMTENWKALFWYFCCFFVCSFFVVFLLFFGFLCFFGGFKGQVRWPEGPPHLALNPPYLFLFCFFAFVFYFVFLDPKGHLTWP